MYGGWILLPLRVHVVNVVGVGAAEEVVRAVGEGAIGAGEDGGLGAGGETRAGTKKHPRLLHVGFREHIGWFVKGFS